MSVREANVDVVPQPETEVPMGQDVLSTWERFKRRVDREYRQSSFYALLLNFILLVALVAFAGVVVVSGGLSIRPLTLLSLASLPVLVLMHEVVRLVEQEQERAVQEEMEINQKKRNLN
jgi:hypothetical protein